MANLNTIAIRAAVESRLFSHSKKPKVVSDNSVILEKNNRKEGLKNVFKLYKSTIKVFSPTIKRNEKLNGLPYSLKLNLVITPQDKPDFLIHNFTLAAGKKSDVWEIRISAKDSENGASARALEYEIPNTETALDVIKAVLKEVLDWYYKEYYECDLDKFPTRLAKRKFSPQGWEDTRISGNFPQEISLN